MSFIQKFKVFCEFVLTINRIYSIILLVATRLLVDGV